STRTSVHERAQRAMLNKRPESCPCGSNKAFADCCEPLMAQARRAETPEELMRSRYSAYVVGDIDYLVRSSHPKARKDFDTQAAKQWSQQSEWMGLKTLGTQQGGPA